MSGPNAAPAPHRGRLDGKVAIVTGGTKNIGRATARAFVAAGADVVVTARNEVGLQDTRAELEALGGGSIMVIAADSTADHDIQRSVDATLERFGGVDILVNNAYFSGWLGGRHPGIETTRDEWDTIWHGNVLAPFRYAQLVQPAMQARGGGSIINLLSIAATRYVDGLLAYATSKSALATITRYLAVELAPTIRVNAISPGAISPDGEPMGSLQRQLAEVAPMHRVGSADELAAVALFLASDASSFVTGQVIVSDGGVSARAW